MAWSVWQAYVVDTAGNIVASPTVTVTNASTGATVSIASDVDGTAKTNPFTGTAGGFVQFYAAGGRYNITATDGSTTVTFGDVLIGSAAGVDTGTSSGNVPTVAQGLTIYEPLRLNNYSGSAAPTVNDDSADGYTAGSLWVDTSVSPAETYICIDNTAGAAVWVSVNLTIGDVGTMALQDANAVAITGGTIAGLSSPLAIADGGTGSTTQSGARTALGLGTAAVAATGDFATAAQGTLADSALQAGDNISVLTNDAGYITGLATPFEVTGNDTADATWDGKPIHVTAAAVITLPQASTYNARVGFTFDVFRDTSGAVTFVSEGSDVIKTTVGGTTIGITDIYGWASVMKIEAGVWAIVGQIEDAAP